MKQALLIVDMINDFVADDGVLRVADAKEFVPVIQKLKKKFDHVIFVNDAHEENDPEFERWSKHAVKGTKGSRIYKGLCNTKDIVFEKTKLSCFTNPNVHKYLLREKIDELVVAGVATEYCVRGAVLDALRFGLKVTIVVDAVAGVDLQKGDQFKALLEMGNEGAKPIYSKDIIENDK